ncbi:TonB-dependent receptor [Flagellimonas halotolerans]|uniref:TonB-dependent receptor n=1 Tax=Flagellimonas halotolerans TaxID=3112164 RepID=A0ABU6ITU9_9FLAO|nr:MULTISPECIES: TonB-dependent receptor [unclassified Allomuricauda]MEC3966636.1 TonB-dependent receptor [Muricauda sp. SYSU M86414]MEC4266558.1 TonB-dependent receptor [Muricauda sp. SYSU M84420]
MQNLKSTLPLILIFFTLTFYAQEVTVLDADTGVPVDNIAIFNKDQSKTTVTDFNGKSELDIFSSDEKITFKHISYATYTTTKNQIERRGNRVYLHLKTEELQEVVMSVSKWEQQKKHIPQKIETFDARNIAFTAPQTSADLLQHSGKVFVQKSQLGGGSPMIRGFATNRILLSVDGVRMNNAIFRGGNLQNVISIDPFTIKKTEVTFGPGSVIYGSDAIGGVMNFYTQKPRFSFTDSLAFSANVNYRYSTANNENTAHIDFNFGKQKWASYTSFTYNNFDDLKMGKHGPESYLRNNYVVRENGTDVLVANDEPKKQVGSGYDQVNLLQKFTYKPNSAWNYDLGLYYSETSDFPRYDRLIRPSKDGDGLRSAEWYYGPQKWFMGNFQITQKGKNKFYDGVKLTTAYQFFEESRHDRGFQDPELYSTREKVDALSVNLDFENKKMGDLHLYYGAEYVFNKVDSKGSMQDIETDEVSETASRYPDGSTWQTLAGYINGEYQLKPNLTLLSGIRYSQVWVDAIFDTTYYTFPFDEADIVTGALTGSLGISWFPRSDLQVTLNGSTGFRAPNIDDIGKIFDSEPGSVVVPNPDLEPEYAYNGELGLRKNFNDVLVLKGATYYTYLVDALVRRDFTFGGQTEIEYNGEPSNVQAIQNAAKAYVYGFEFGLEAYFNEHLSLNSNLTLTKGVEEDDDGTDSPSRHAAPTFGDVHLIWENQKLKADVFVNYNGEVSNNDLALSEQGKTYMYASDANGNPFSPSWYTLNFRSQYQITNALKASVSLENMTNQRYRMYSSGIAAPGVNLVLGLGYVF